MNSATLDQPFLFSPNRVSPSPISGGADTASVAAAPDSLVDQTRREIAEIVREVALAVRSDRSRGQFLSMLVDRILRAMSAEGVVVWQVEAADPWSLSAAQRIGQITDRSIASPSQPTHDQMLCEVIAGGQPVVVPPTPGASDTDRPANPTRVAAAVVPIHSDPLSPHASYVLEVFLEPDCGLTTQRGYLRFVAQMADLAGEFLRNDQLRRMQHKQQIAKQIDTLIASLHLAKNRLQIEAVAVDAVADLFGFDRVGLCHVRGGNGKVVAVSHASTIDRHAAAAKQIEAIVENEYQPNCCCWLEPDESSDVMLQPRVVVSSEEPDTVSLVGLSLADSPTDCQDLGDELQRIVDHAAIAIRHARAIEAIPGGRWIVSLSSQACRPRASRWVGFLAMVAVMTLLFVVAFFPVPMMVSSPATLRPADVQRLFASRAAVVDTIHVAHGDSVRQGQPLMTMRDPALREQITSLLGRRAVLAQKQSAFTAELVDTASHRIDRSEQLQGERSLLAEEMYTLDEQLALLEQVEASLVLRAGRDGIVDAWQLERRLLGKPVERGERLLEVIARETDWLVDARVPLSKMNSIRSASQAGSLRAAVLMDNTDANSVPASLEAVGPTLQHSTDGADSKAVVLRLDHEGISRLTTRLSAAEMPSKGPVSGAPVRVLFRCDTAPLVSVLFHDAIESLRNHASLYLSINSSSSADVP
ncbi:HlyD family efflux transporter periplasmic adaptor subunit [Novipirellula artificiosorum]|uniref:HlyD family secretion protein n=1 Tax=Novipirellula artificiosorum TaxID=2528016 RepID=A0A5C6DX17_9BACT|nr:efflux RND transporter periplasmic adaptor subunit [Novipirellula artificiosorum]TWU40754.1 hypothetical protein Poly41_15890 [Novipirellula artificiosorum]